MLKLARLAMRTRFEIAIADEDVEANLRAAGEEAFDEIERLEAQLSVYRPDSDLTRINLRAAQEPVRVDPRVFSFLKRARELSEQCGGAFDMTVGPLLKLWGLTGQPREQLPAEEEINAARELCGMATVLMLDETDFTVRFTRPGVRLDPGAIGKGYALERAAQLLREAGIRSALLHGGTSSVVAIGKPPGELFWRVAIRHPLEEHTLLAEAALKDAESFSVSAPHGKAVEIAGRRFGHVLDPRSGRPVEGALLAGVISSSATESDALSTALLVLGEQGLDALAPRVKAQIVCVQRGGATVEPRAHGDGITVF
ncbi:MAG TPA: FAD:protein FMN transferase [Planctomycetota bacterium]|nr:FAD:protein FMN transferase [Planctomycetota bacterium]